MYSKIISGAFLGVSAFLVSVEVDVSEGLPSFSMVGSLSCEVREAKERVWAALKNIGLAIPPTHITVNLSPADLKKGGTAMDLPIAVGLLEALKYFREGSAKDILFLGELGLNGEVKTVHGVLPVVREAVKWGVRECIVPKVNVAEAAVIPEMTVRGVGSLQELLHFLQAKEEDRNGLLPPQKIKVQKLFEKNKAGEELDFSQVNGQESAKRAAQIAAAGFHNLLMVGPPGAGKSMIAKRIPGIMPPLTLEESLEVTSIYSVAGLLKEDQALVTERPFQSPHHTISQSALTGGGSVPKPGIISLAHRGVLFLDELPEFSRNVLDSMRQPLENHEIQVVRVNGNVCYPADFMLVGAMNPCCCGYYPDRNRCRCSQVQIKKYMGKISGPLLDRIDLCVELMPVDITGLQDARKGLGSERLKAGVELALKRQKERFLGTGYHFNSELTGDDVEKYCTLGKAQKRCMESLYHSMELSARVYHKIIKVARTIADLEDSEQIEEEHLLEAACYRPSEEYWL